MQSAMEVGDLKKKIEKAKGSHKYPVERQVLVHRGKVLKDETTLEDNNVDENGFIVVMISPINRSCGETSTAAAAPPVAEFISCTLASPPPSPEDEPSTTIPEAHVQLVSVQPTQAAAAGGGMPNAIPLNLFPQDVDPEPETSCTPAAPPPSPEDSSTTTAAAVSVQPTQAGGGERQNSIPLNLFPQDLADTMTRWTLRTDLDILRNSPRFRTFRNIVHVFPDVLQSWLEDLRERNPRIYRFIRRHQADFDALMNEGRGDLEWDSNLTVDEMAAIFRLEEMGFERSLVIQVFWECNKNEEQAANYLLDHMHDDDYDDDDK